MRHINTSLSLSPIVITRVYLSTNFQAVKCVSSLYLSPLFVHFVFPKVLTKAEFIFHAASDNDSSASRKGLLYGEFSR